MYMYIDIHTHMYQYTYAYNYTYLHVYIHTHIIRTHTCVHMDCINIMAATTMTTLLKPISDQDVAVFISFRGLISRVVQRPLLQRRLRPC
jgi:hypothetical protein